MPVDPPPRFVFSICERVEALGRLQAWETSGVRQINSPAAVLNTYRERMIAHFEGARVPFIESRIVSTGASHPPTTPVWIKRADVHNIEDGDVAFAATEAAARDALAVLAARGIPRAVLPAARRRRPDQVLGIGRGGGPDGGPPWFRWFYHKDQALAGHLVEPRRLGALARRAAAALDLEVYGGDVIVTATGDLVLLDLNAWPSFAL